MSHHEKKARTPGMPAEEQADDTEGQSRRTNMAVPTEPAEKTDENPTGDDTQGQTWRIRE